MANATDRVKKGTVRKTDEFIVLALSGTAAERTFWPNAMLGVTTAGYVDKFDDSQSMLFLGVFDGDEGKLVQPIESANTRNIRLQQPQRLELTVSGVAITDVGKKVYAVDDQTGTLDASTRTYANLIGIVVARVATNIALVEPFYDGIAAHKRLGSTRVLAATGNQTLTKYDLNKVIICPNTAAHEVALPAVADTQAGDTLIFVKTTADAQAVTLNPNSTETIDNASTLATIDARYDCATLVSTGSEWVVLNRDIA